MTCGGLIPYVTMLLLFAAACSVLEQLHRVSQGHAAMLQAGSTVALAAASYLVWQQCNPKSS